MKLLRIIWLSCVVAFGASGAYAQGCVETLTQAEAEFTAGRFYSIPSILNECINGNQFTQEQLVRAYMLLTQVYLLTDDPIGAETSYLKLLMASPEYIATEEVDPIDVVYLSKKFTSTPIFTPHYKVGLLVSRQTLLDDNNAYGNRQTVKRHQTSKIGWSVGAGIEWNITDNWGLGGELFASSKGFGTDYTGIFLNDSLITKERQYWIDLPLYLRYGDSKGKIRPYGYVGHSFNFLLTANLEGFYTNKGASSSEGEVPVGEQTLNVTYNRNFVNRSLVVGGGVKIKTGKDFFVFDLRLAAGLTNLSKGSYYNEGTTELWTGSTRYGHLPNDFRLNSLILTFGYVKPLYDPRKIKKARTKSVSRKMSRESK